MVRVENVSAEELAANAAPVKLSDVLLQSLKFLTRSVMAGELVKVKPVRLNEAPLVCKLKPSTALVADPPLITPTVLLVSGERDIEVAELPNVVVEVTVMILVPETPTVGTVSEVMLLGVVIDTLMFVVPVLLKLKPEPVKLATPEPKLAGALLGPIVPFDVLTVNVLEAPMPRSLLRLTSTASNMGC